VNKKRIAHSLLLLTTTIIYSQTPEELLEIFTPQEQSIIVTKNTFTHRYITEKKGQKKIHDSLYSKTVQELETLKICKELCGQQEFKRLLHNNFQFHKKQGNLHSA
jgi:hypothetical protein